MKTLCLDGPSGSGKSHLLARARGDARLQVIPKLTTRPRRRGDNDWEFQFKDRITPGKGRVIWESVGSSYAVDTESIERAHQSGKVPILICTEVSALEALATLGPLELFYIYRHQTPSALAHLLAERSTSDPQIQARLQELADVPCDYARKLKHITGVILNLSTLSSLEGQFDTLLARAQTLRPATCQHGGN